MKRVLMVWRAVVEAAVRERADLIVIGSHGYGGIDRLLDTTAAKIVDHANRSCGSPRTWRTPTMSATTSMRI